MDSCFGRNDESSVILLGARCKTFELVLQSGSRSLPRQKEERITYLERPDLKGSKLKAARQRQDSVHKIAKNGCWRPSGIVTV